MKFPQLEYFIGKYCTIITTPINRDFRSENPNTYPEPLYHYFMGKVVSVDSNGIMVEQWATGPKRLKTYFLMPSVIAVSEEETLDPSDPRDAAQINLIKEETSKATKQAENHLEELKKQQDQSPFLDINKLSEIQKEGINILKDKP